MSRRHFTFACAGDTLFGTLDEAPGTTGLLLVSGGNEIRSGAFAKTWIADMDNGEAELHRRRTEATGKQIETVGEELRSLMRREDASAVR